jgi:ribosomal protein S18 acetylase RimI-like enzyme
LASIREFTLDDYDAVRALWEQSPEGIGLGRSDTRAEIAKKLARDPDLFLVAEEDGKIVGAVIGGFDGRRGLVYHLAVDKEKRGNGLGRALMEEVERRLVAKGCIRVYLVVKRENEPVMDFYRHLGWEVMNVTLMGKNIT